MLPTERLHELRAWQAQDPDPATVAALDQLIGRAESGDANAVAEIVDAFSGRLAFGTAGLRAALGPGPNRMNRVVVVQAAAGLAMWLRNNGYQGCRVVIGYDARYNSAAFAQATAEVLAGYQFEAILIDRHVPTPLVAFALNELGCDAGVMVTASHNPPQDNGYKVYVGRSQIVPPIDVGIAASIEEAAARPLGTIPVSDSYQTIGDALVSAYVARAASLVGSEAPRDLAWAYTPLHGVGADVVARVLAATGFPAPALVDAQALPDPSFPTVAFPNPEEPGAMDLALDLARKVDADVAIANDPDADRCALAAPFGGSWRMLTGDELGWLLADDALRRGTQGTYACSVVSSTLLAAMARSAGQPFAMTLTGFKWIGRVPELALGYEEAIGYCTDPEAVADKDGITTLTRLLVLVAGLKAVGVTVAERLDEIARTFGVHATAQVSFRVEDLSLITDSMVRLRANLPATLAGIAVTASDLNEGWNGLPPTDGVLFEGDGVRAVARPSGTEPKLKVYLQANLSAEMSQDLPVARAAASARLAQLKADMTSALGL